MPQSGAAAAAVVAWLAAGGADRIIVGALEDHLAGDLADAGAIEALSVQLGQLVALREGIGERSTELIAGNWTASNRYVYARAYD